MVKAEVYIFGNVVTGELSPGLSDIDIAVVSDEFKDKRIRLKVYGVLLEKYFYSLLEFHLLTRKSGHI